ncbi:MAG: CvpA family protein [Desulfitobacteriaceae bacterium]|nr:CvpA family protein [Desulfitobacteriaceae bacterium]MDD4346558.1 CvpA family protein [Desulfitobacteriaceae bacterium]MDD4401920.1 CvpA family protein [Desulfitobacteriaceae bacterium]
MFEQNKRVKPIRRKGLPPIATALIITTIFALVIFYLMLPALNPKNPDFYIFLCVCLLVYCIVVVKAKGIEIGLTNIRPALQIFKRYCTVPFFICLGLVLVLIIGNIVSNVVLQARAYSKLLPVETGDFATEVKQISYDQIPMLDKISAQRLGDRKLGELADMVSQFTVVNDYNQMNYGNQPVRVATLAYADIFKWIANRAEGIPAYIIIDMVTQNVEVVRLEEGIKYTNAEHFSRNINRHLRFNYPTYMFARPHLEIDDNKHPYWICPKIEKTIGLFGGTDINGVVLVDAVTGECTYHKDVPNWVDQVYSAELIISQYDYYGRYAGGFLNSLFGQKNVTVTTDGHNYIAQDDDLYVYTGITSVTGDQSNIGFVLVNQRTKDTRYYACAGAEEYSAMNSAQGVVQHLGYIATFPLLLNIADHPTYFVALKDNAGLVKMYAMVNVQQYNIVATGMTVAECETVYIRMLSQNGLMNEVPILKSGVEGIVEDIRIAVINGTSVYYLLLDSSETYYAVSAADSESIMLVNKGDLVSIQAVEAAGDGAIVSATGLERLSDKP